MKAVTLLQNFDIDELDIYETLLFNKYTNTMNKAEALQILINNVEGDHTQLSDTLSQIAEIQTEEENENNFKK